MFVRHHIHSIMSARDAMLKIEDIVSEAIKSNESFSICDHGSIAGWIQLYNICKKNNIKPIFGIEAYINQHRDRLLEIVKVINSLGDSDIDKDEKKKLQLERDHIKKHDHIVLIAKNQTGFHNIIELANSGYLNGFYTKPTITYDELFKYKNGIIVTSACLGGTLNRYILNNDIESAIKYSINMKEQFGDDFYIEVQANRIPEQITANKELIKIAKKLNIPMIIGMDSHYLDKESQIAHQDLLLLQNKNIRSDIGKSDIGITFENNKGEIKYKKVEPDKEFRKGFLAKDVKIGDTFKKDVVIDIKEVKRVWEFSGDAFYMSESELKEYIKINHKELIPFINDVFKGNYEIYDKIENIELDTNIKLPTIENADKVLTEKVKQGLIDYGFSKKRKYIERAKYELNVIKINGFSTYFLILADFIEYAKNNNIPTGAGRGCFNGDVKIYTNKGYVKLCDIKIGDIVKTHTNKFKKVLNTYKYDCDETLLCFKTDSNKNIEGVTHNHKIFAIKKKEYENGIRIPKWIESKFLEEGDFIAYYE